MANNLNHGWLIVCSVCNEHTYSPGEFITHLESHVDLQNNVVRNLYVNYPSELIPNTHQAYFRREMLMQETINVIDARVFPAPPQQPMVMPQPLPSRTNRFPNVNRVAASQPIQSPIQFFQPEVMTFAGSTVAETAQLPTPTIHPMVMPQPQPSRTNRFPNVDWVAASQPIQPPPQYQPEVMTFAGSIVDETVQLPVPTIHPNQPEMMDMEVSTIDGTRPYINLLEKPINNNECVNVVNMYVANLDFQILDLDLKL